MSAAIQRTRSKKDERLDVRLTQQVKEIIEQAACICGQSVTDFAVSRLLQSAEDVLERHQSIRLSNRDRGIFLELISSDEQPNDALVGAAKRYKERYS